MHFFNTFPKIKNGFGIKNATFQRAPDLNLREELQLKDFY